MTTPFELERAALGELEPAALEALRSASDAEGQPLEAALQEIDRSDAEILGALPPPQVAREVLRRAARVEQQEASRRSRQWGWMGGMSVAVGAAAVLLLVVPQESPVPADPGVRAKGESLRLALLDGSGSELGPRALAQAGDTIGLRVTAQAGVFLAVVSVDGAGAITHHPTAFAGGRVLKGGTTVLPVGYTLDAAPGFERFFVITSPTPLEMSAMNHALKELVATGRAQTGTLEAQGWTVIDETLLKPSVEGAEGATEQPLPRR